MTSCQGNDFQKAVLFLMGNLKIHVIKASDAVIRCPFVVKLDKLMNKQNMLAIWDQSIHQWLSTVAALQFALPHVMNNLHGNVSFQQYNCRGFVIVHRIIHIALKIASPEHTWSYQMHVVSDLHKGHLPHTLSVFTWTKRLDTIMV